MNDPFSKMVRRHIPWEQYTQVEVEFSKASLIGESAFTLSHASTRASVLRAAETRLGFVYVGERKWLENCIANACVAPYHAWVSAQLEEVVFPNGLAYDSTEPDGGCWRGYTEDTSIFWWDTQLSLDALGYQDVGLCIPGDRDGVFESYMPHAFEVLHNIAYYLHNAAVWYMSNPVLGENAGLDGIRLYHVRDRWSIDLINEYGAASGIVFDGSVIVGWEHAI